MYSSRYGIVARLKIDIMPCIMPYADAKAIPNPAKNKRTPSDIPNLWKRPLEKQPEVKLKPPFSPTPPKISIPDPSKKYLPRENKRGKSDR